VVALGLAEEGRHKTCPYQLPADRVLAYRAFRDRLFQDREIRELQRRRRCSPRQSLLFIEEDIQIVHSVDFIPWVLRLKTACAARAR
jgi:hypothetical protein